MTNIVFECDSHEPFPNRIVRLANEVQDGRGKIHVRDGALELTAKTNSTDLVDRRTAVRSHNVDVAANICLTRLRQLRVGEKRKDEHMLASRDRPSLGKMGNRVRRGLPLLLPISVSGDKQPTTEPIDGASRFSVGREFAAIISPEPIIGKRERGDEQEEGEQTLHGPNENKMSDGGRGRAPLGIEVWKSSQKWSVQRSAVRSIAWLDLFVFIAVFAAFGIPKQSPCVCHVKPTLLRVGRKTFGAVAI